MFATATILPFSTTASTRSWRENLASVKNDHEVAQSSRIVVARLTDHEPHDRIVEERLAQHVDCLVEPVACNGLDGWSRSPCML